MARVLVVEDDPDQRGLRRLLLERAGYEVDVAGDSAEAERICAERAPAVVVMDLHLPRAEDGGALIDRLRKLSPAPRIIVLTGSAEAPEARLADLVIAKPCRSAKLMEMLSRLLLCLLLIAPAVTARTFPFRVSQPGEVVAEVEMSSPGADWAKPGAEAAVATLTLDGQAQQHLMLYAAEVWKYRVFLGPLAAGDHTLAVDRNARFSAKLAGLEVAGVKFEELPAADTVVAHAPVLFARANTVGGFTDIPLLVYCERLIEDGQALLQYSVIFSNEDGGTPTRALMARWGRTTDIEYVYRVWLDAAGRPARATIQTKDHKEVEYRGARLGAHPILMPVTDNNMVVPDGSSPIRYQLAPILADLSAAAREKVMNDNPITWRVAAQEMKREGKIRPFGTVDGEKIGDPRSYLYIEALIGNRDSRSAFLVRLRGERRWRVSHLGKIENGIERGGWVTSTIELPPGTTPGRIAEFGFECLTREKIQTGGCRIEQIGKLYFLDRDYRPGASFWSAKPAAAVPSGEILTWSLESK